MSVSAEQVPSLLAFLRDGDGPPIFDGQVDGKAPPAYVLVFTQLAEYDSDRLAAPIRPSLHTATFHSVGTTVEQARWVASWLEGRLAGARIAVPGWDSGRVEPSWSRTVQLDDNEPPYVYFFADEYAWESTPIGG